MSPRSVALAVCVFAAPLFLGCGGSNELAVVPVKGKILCEGEPVTAGTIIFMPVAADKKEVSGRPARGTIQTDGTFVLSTYEFGDGAIIGKHTVTYKPPVKGEGAYEEAEEAEGGEQELAVVPPLQKHACRFGGTATATVKAGDNNLTIELSPVMPGGGERAEEMAF